MGEMNSRTDRPASGADRTARRGLVTVLSGCMFSGKTTELLRQLTSLKSGAGVAFKHLIDDRYRCDALVSHAGKSYSAFAVSSPSRMLEHLHSAVELIAIDDAHFFATDLGPIVERWAESGIDVIVACLDLDSWGRPFPLCRDLCSIADQSVTTYAICARCGSVGDRTQRLTPIVDGRLVGGPESYEPRCKRCWRPPPEARPGESPMQNMAEASESIRLPRSVSR